MPKAILILISVLLLSSISSAGIGMGRAKCPYANKNIVMSMAGSLFDDRTNARFMSSVPKADVSTNYKKVPVKK